MFEVCCVNHTLRFVQYTTCDPCSRSHTHARTPQKLEGLDQLPNLETLFLGKNKIVKMEGLEKLTKLKLLSLQSNRVAKIEGLANCMQLEELYLSHNDIQEVEGLDTLVTVVMMSSVFVVCVCVCVCGSISGLMVVMSL